MKEYPIEPDRREISRYLGYRAATPDEKVAESIERCVRRLQEVVTPGFVSAVFPLETAGKDRIRFADVTVESKNLARNLRGCLQVVLFAATLGVGPDRLIARAAIGHASDMVILQAASAAMIEAYCDSKNKEIRRQAAQKKLYCRPRFSPGYGDFSLEHQRDMLRILQTPKKIGLTLTESLLMAPSKSVTAVIGLSTEKEPCPLSGCEVCEKTDCAFRRGSNA